MNTFERKAFSGHAGADGKSHDATGEAVAAGFSRRSLATNAPCSMVT